MLIRSIAWHVSGKERCDEKMVRSWFGRNFFEAELEGTVSSLSLSPLRLLHFLPTTTYPTNMVSWLTLSLSLPCQAVTSLRLYACALPSVASIEKKLSRPNPRLTTSFSFIRWRRWSTSLYTRSIYSSSTPAVHLSLTLPRSFPHVIANSSLPSLFSFRVEDSLSGLRLERKERRLDAPVRQEQKAN